MHKLLNEPLQKQIAFSLKQKLENKCVRDYSLIPILNFGIHECFAFEAASFLKRAE